MRSLSRPSSSWALSISAVLLFLITVAPPAAHAQDDPNVVYDPVLYEAMEYRTIGPYRGGRVTAVDGFPDNPYTFLMGSVGGGVWKTSDGGETWHNITDGYLNVGPVGAIAIAPSDPNVIYVGTGSGGVRGNISVGDGVYKSTDGGETWTHLGLPESEHINRIWVHPENPNRVYVATLGHIFGPHEERGVYRSTDGGQTWTKVLYVSEHTGAIDLVMNPKNPRVLYAAMWQAERKPWAMHSGGNEGGVWKTTDGGDSWTRLTKGLPPDSVGRIGLAVSPANPDRVYALVEAKNNRGLYRSDDAGKSFTRVSDDRNLMARPWYYMHVDAHPTNENVVYVSNEGFYKSIDGGKHFEAVDTPHGDNHDLWINPEHPEVMIQSNDGGANISVNGGQSWTTQLNQPTAEFYSVTVDDQFPYRVYAPQQDNTTLSIPSRFTRGLTPTSAWREVAGCETGPVVAHPEKPYITYGACQGQISRYNWKTGQERAIWEYPQEYHGRANAELKLRHQWNSQIEISPHDPNVLYHTSQYVHKTTNEGQSWTRISPDLTNWEQHKDLHTTPPGGPITYDQTGVEIYGTIFALEESPHTPGVLWAGSDDGRVHLTRNGGDTWTDITPEGMELHSTINRIELSPHQPGRAFLAVHRYRMDDWHPYIYRTNNYGEDWTLLTPGDNGLPADYPTRVVREDPDRQGLLYAGTEFGMFVSFDDGAHWQSLQLNLPETPITDLKVHRKDLVVATQGRGLWILDDLTPLHQITDAVAEADAHLFTPRATYRMRLDYTGSRGGDNPPEGTMIFYHFAEEPAQEVTLAITDAQGDTVKTYSSVPDEADQDRPLSTAAGMHRFVWDLHYPDAFLAEGVDESAPSGSRERIAPVTGYTGGPYAVPGTYRVTLAIGDDWHQTRSFEVKKDPRLDVTRQDLQELFDFSIRVRDKIAAIQHRVSQVQTVLDELTTVAERVEDPAVMERAAAIKKHLEAVAGELYKYGERGDHAHLHPELTTSYARIGSMLISADHPPTESAYQRFKDLEPEFERHIGRLEEILNTEVASFNQMLRERGVQPVMMPASSPSSDAD